jgi:hypothetical protein
LSTWQALQTWIAASTTEVAITYAPDLARMVPPVAVRLRRDFRIVLTLICAHALLHQASRRKDADGSVVAEIADYATIRELVADLIAEGADATIKPEIREVVGAVADLLTNGRDEVRQADLKGVLSIDKSAISRRVAAALQAGVLRNLEDRKGRPARLVLGDPLPEEIELLPKPERLHGCAVVEGDNAGPPRCACCGKAKLSSDPLLTASTDGEMFVAHRSCLDREAPFDRTSSGVTGDLANGKAPDLRAVASSADGANRGSRETLSADSLKSDVGAVADANLRPQSEPGKLGASNWRMRL